MGDPAKPIAPSGQQRQEHRRSNCSRGEDRNCSCCFIYASAWPNVSLWEYADETGPKSKALSFCESSVHRVLCGKQVFLLARQCFTHPRVEPVPEHPQPAQPRLPVHGQSTMPSSAFVSLQPRPGWVSAAQGTAAARENLSVSSQKPFCFKKGQP